MVLKIESGVVSAPIVSSGAAEVASRWSIRFQGSAFFSQANVVNAQTPASTGKEEIMRLNRPLSIFLLSLSLAFVPLQKSFACDSGDNFFTHSGILSNLADGPPSVRVVNFNLPSGGDRFEVKVNFLKGELSAAAVDAYIDHLNEQARKRGEIKGSAFWDRVREKLKEMESDAYFEVFDSAGRRVGRVEHLEAVTFFKTIKFRRGDSRYTVRITCTAGAGLYHLTAECD